MGLCIVMKCTVSGHEAISPQENAVSAECCGLIQVMQVHHTHPEEVGVRFEDFWVAPSLGIIRMEMS